MHLFFKQLLILLWKCWIIRRRHWCSSICELFSPVILALYLAYQLRSSLPVEQSSSEWVKPTIYLRPSMQIQFPVHMLGFIDTIYYAPTNDFTNDIMTRVKQILIKRDLVARNASMVSINLKGFPNASMVNARLKDDQFKLQKMNDSNKHSSSNKHESNDDLKNVGVIFVVNNTQHHKLKYTIRMSGDIYDTVHHIFYDKKSAVPATKIQAYERFFCPLQTIINQAYLDKLMDDNRINQTRIDSVAAHQYPYPKYKTGFSSDLFAIEDLIAAVIIIGYTIMCAIIVKRITDEKSIKAKEMLRMMGMSDWIFWISHFINYFTIVLFHDIVFTLLFFVGMGGFPLLGYSDCTLFFVIIAVFGAQFILFCMLFTTIFNKPVLAVVVTVIVYIISYAVLLGTLHPNYTKAEVLGNNHKRILSSLLPTLGLTWCMAIVAQFESYGTGAKWDNLFNHTLLYGGLTLGSILLVMLFSCLLYGILIWYLDAVWPFQFGVPKPLYFPIMPSYWCPKKSSKSKLSLKHSKNKNKNNFEEEPDGKISIQAVNLHKAFGGCGTRKLVAVRDVSLNIYSGQITVLLGHNGAGKTTTMNMITGIFPPTSGTVIVNGYNVVTQTNNARKSIGLCPQENILFNELTVEQHLKLYAILKDYPCNRVNKEVSNTLKVLQLSDKKKTLSPSLSGGMKRKLSLGIAMIGGTKILILDEPTSGMDPEARRAVWDLLQTLRNERTIFLTTHYMEEADVLGDRIAIMSAGVVKCFGSPMFLKKRFGTGYHLRIAKADNYKSDAVQQLLNKYLPDAHLHSEIHSEVIYSLESNKTKEKQTTAAVFPKLFDEIEQNKEKLGIASCGVSITTMEDVFLRVGNEDFNEGNDLKKDSSKKKRMSQKSYKKLDGNDLHKSRFIGLLIKRFHFAKRYIPMLVFLLLVPALLFIVLLLLDNDIRSDKKHQSVDLSLDLEQLYGQTKGFFKLSNKTQNSDYGNLAQTYNKTASKHGMKTSILSKENPNDWALKDSGDIETYIKTYLIGAEVSRSADTEVENVVLHAWYNSEAMHALPISINILYESLINLLFADKQQQFSISVSNYPIAANEEMANFIIIIFAFVVSCLVILPITVPFIGASYILFPIIERTSNSKLLQIMTGLSVFMFWFCNFLFDMVFHLLAVIVIYAIIFIFDVNKIFFGQFDTAIALLLILLLFGFASIPIAYCFSLCFSKPSTGFVTLVIVYLVFGFISLLILGFMNFFHSYMGINLINETLFYGLICTFRLVPIFAMCFAIQKIYLLGSFAQSCRDMSHFLVTVCPNIEKGRFIGALFYRCCKDKCGNECYETMSPFRFDDYGIGLELLAMLFVGIAAFLFLMFLESNMLRKMFSESDTKAKYRPSRGEDSDVTAERQRIEKLRDQKKLKEEAIAVINLTKNFNTMKLTGSKIFTAVDHLTFGIHKKECFGLLGVNGAGKTTTFRMLCGDLSITDGNAFIANYNVVSDLHDFQKHIGYCPQFDALLDKLTGSETLYLFARLRGIPSKHISKEVSDLIKMVDLQEHANKRTETYSGGNRRKLSLALAIIGNPNVLFLDEPTAGVDPTARRKIWSTLTSIQEHYDTSIVLTSHSMEECEALCSRIAIMVNGMFKCFGASQHLRSKFGQGFTLIIKIKRKLNDDNKYMETVQQYIHSELPSAVLKDSHQCLLHYHITDTSVQWSKLFGVMEKAKHKLEFEDYVVSDTTLEQIFLAFAKTQRELLQ